MTTYTYTGGKFIPTGGGTVIDPAGGFTSTLVSKDSGAPTKIMPLGDSITLGQGGAATGGYRMLLAEKLRAAGFYFNYVGWNTTKYLYASDTTYADRNSGFSAYGGWTIQDMADQNAGRAGLPAGSPLGTAGAGAWVTTYNPDLIILKAGTNNASDSSGVRTAAMHTLMQQIFTAKPTVKIIWCTVLWQQANQTTYPFNTEWAAEMATWTGKTIVKAETQAAVGTTSTNFTDLVHPDTLGYGRMASAIFQAIVTN